MSRQTEAGPGERAARATSRTRWIVLGLLAAIGFVVGFAAAMVEEDGAPWSVGGTIPPVFAIIAAVVMLAAMGWGSWRYHQTTDELQRRDNLFGAAVGANFFLAGYPTWLILWKGGLVPEPDHALLYIAFFVVTFAAYAWRKFR